VHVLKVDLHLHTADDPIDRLFHTSFDLVNRAAELGFDALAITLHEIQLADSRLSAHARDRGIILIPGTERTIEGYHVLMLNFPGAAAESVRTFDELARLKARTGGLVIAPHPYFPVRHCLQTKLDAHRDLFDAVEWSYFWTRAVNFNARAARWAHAHGKPLVGNSDLHDIRQIGRTYSRIDAPRDASAICEAVRSGRVALHTEPAPVLQLADIFARLGLRPRKRPAPVSSAGVLIGR
jgi:predicted metal-dependent phosphoesterase TrpH